VGQWWESERVSECKGCQGERGMVRTVSHGCEDIDFIALKGRRRDDRLGAGVVVEVRVGSR